MKALKFDSSTLWANVCLDDNVNAFEVLHNQLLNRLIKFCINYTGQKEAAEEIVYDIFTKCWENRKSPTVILDVETYLFVAVRNQSLKYMKKQANMRLVEIESLPGINFIDSTDPEKELNNKELHSKLDQAIEELPPQAKIIFRMIKENGMKYKEVAEILEISPRTVQTQLFRAIAKLRVALHSYHKSELNKLQES